jgi:hypothetical protein
MKLLGIRLAFLATSLGVAAACISCSHQDTHNSKAATAKNAKPGPEESFDLIIETFRRRMEETPIGFVISDSSGRSTMTGTNKVSHELIRPANETDPYKAVITVTSQSRYSIKRAKDSSEDADREKNADPKADNPLAETGDDSGVESFDPGLIGKPAAESSKTSGPARTTPDVIRRPPDEEVRKYELLYQNGRWILVTELSKETEQSIQNAFNSALDTQI